MKVLVAGLCCLAVLMLTLMIGCRRYGYGVRVGGSLSPLVLGIVIQHQHRMFDWPLRMVFGPRGPFLEVRRPGFDEDDAHGRVFTAGNPP